MIHSIRKLAREVHRRSVWQVVAVYLLVAWAILAAADRLTAVAGLPSWTPGLTLVLLVVLFPLVVATAVVQEGLPGLRIVDEIDPNELEGRTPEEVHVVPEAHPLHGTGPFTWRNSLLGGVAAGTLLLASVVAYLSMWALGIGPVGSLLAQGVIAEGDELGVTTFVSHADDPSLGALVSDLLELALAQSSVVRVTVGDQPSPAAVVLVDGEVAPVAGGYEVSARIVLAAEGATLARFEELVVDGNLDAMVERLSERIRERLGESLRSVRQGARSTGVGSVSEDALSLHRQALAAAHGGNHEAAISLLEDALSIDGAFALGWRALGNAREQLDDLSGAVSAYRRAIDLWSARPGGGRTVRVLRDRVTAIGG